MRVFVAEFVGTALLLAGVVGSGIMGERLAGGNVAIAARQHPRHRCDARGAHPRLWTGLRCAPQPGRVVRRRVARRHFVATRFRVCDRTGERSDPRRRHRRLHVRAAGVRVVTACSCRCAAGLQRSGSDVRSPRGHLGLFAAPFRGNTIRRRRLHSYGTTFVSVSLCSSTRADGVATHPAEHWL